MYCFCRKQMLVYTSSLRNIKPMNSNFISLRKLPTLNTSTWESSCSTPWKLWTRGIPWQLSHWLHCLMTSKLWSWTFSTSFTPTKLCSSTVHHFQLKHSLLRERPSLPSIPVQTHDTTLLKSYSQALWPPPSQSTSTITRSTDSPCHQAHADPETSRHTLKRPVSQTSRPSATTSASADMATKSIRFTHHASRVGFSPCNSPCVASRGSNLHEA